MTADELLANLTRLGIELVAHGNRLRYRPRSAMTTDLAEQLKVHRGELLATLRLAGASERLISTMTGEGPGPTKEASVPACDLMEWEGCVDLQAPCPDCGELVFWWGPLDDQRCMTCDPPTMAVRLLERAERIRRRHSIPSPPGAAEMLADLRKLT